MIIMIGGVPCSGKSTLIREIISGLGSAENVEPMKLFPCQKYNDILVVGRYPAGEILGEQTDLVMERLISLEIL